MPMETKDFVWFDIIEAAKIKRIDGFNYEPAVESNCLAARTVVPNIYSALWLNDST